MPVKTKRLLKALSAHYGYREVRKGKGDHCIWKNNEKTLVIPMKSSLKQGTYLSILRQAGINREEFESLL